MLALSDVDEILSGIGSVRVANDRNAWGIPMCASSIVSSGAATRFRLGTIVVAKV